MCEIDLSKTFKACEIQAEEIGAFITAYKKALGKKNIKAIEFLAELFKDKDFRIVELAGIFGTKRPIERSVTFKWDGGNSFKIQY